MKGIFYYDGGCGLCQHWTQYWKKLVGSSVEFRTFENADDKTSPEYIDSRGVVFRGARSVFELLANSPGKRWYRWLYLHLPPFAFLSETVYKIISACRSCTAKATHFLWGSEIEPATYFFTRRLFLRFLGLIYLIAFVSFYVQIPGLVGENGILPVGEFLDGAREAFGNQAIFQFPTLAWISHADLFLGFLAVLGAVFAVLAVIGIQLVPIFFMLWILYLSVCYTGQTFMSYPWDMLLLEVGFLAMFFAPTRFGDKHDAPHLIVWLYRLLVFRIMIGFGVSILSSGAYNIPDISVLDFHYWIQPLPNAVSWFAHQMPWWLDRIVALVMLVVGLVIPFLVFAPRRLRFFAAFCFIVLQVWIGITGNFAFYNLLAIILALLLFDDRFFNRSPKRYVSRAGKAQVRFSQIVAGVVLTLTIVGTPTSLRIVNSYGFFSRMTTSRPEIVLQGIMDGETWSDYEFKYKPGDVNRRPPFVALFQPRLDWQMWLAARSTYEQNQWFVDFAESLLRARPEVLGLLAQDPFNGERPLQLRAALYKYRFTTPEERKSTGAWWSREAEGLYLPVATLEAGVR